MKVVISLCSRAIRIGPLPYLGLSVAIMLIGAVLQMRSTAPVMPDGTTIFGLFAKIGGFVGLFGLVPLILSGPYTKGEDRDPAHRAPRSASQVPDPPRERSARDEDQRRLSSLRKALYRQNA